MKKQFNFQQRIQVKIIFVHYKYGVKRVKFEVASWELNIYKLILKKQEQMSPQNV